MPTDLRSSGYGQGREMPALRTGVLMEDQVSADGATGCLFSQPIVRGDARVVRGDAPIVRGDARVVRESGQEVRFDDLLGSGFAVVGKTQAALDMSPRSKRILDRLGAAVVSTENIETARGHFDRGFASADAIVVRPDRYVFGCTSERYDLDQLIDQLARKLHLL